MSYSAGSVLGKMKRWSWLVGLLLVACAPDVDPTTTAAVTTTTEAPTGAKHLVIESDTVLTDIELTLNPGDSIEFRNDAHLMFGGGAVATWTGTPTDTWSGDGTNANLERDINIFGEGSIMFMDGSGPHQISYVHIDLQPPQVVGEYPLHFHLMGDDSRGSIVEGVVIENSTNRAFVTHGSHGITMRDNIAKNVVGQAFWWDFARETPVNDTDDVVWDHNLVDGVTPTPLQNNHRQSAFELGDGENMSATNNVVRNMSIPSSADCSAYSWQEARRGEWVFENNKNFGGNCHGIFVWQNNTNQGHIVEDFISVGESEFCIDHGAYVNNYQYINVTCDRVNVLAGEADSSIAPRFQGGTINELTFGEHRLSGVVRFQDTQVGSVHIDNGSKGCDKHQPGDYQFTNSGLDFSDVTTNRVCPGTTVTIDGVTRNYGD